MTTDTQDSREVVEIVARVLEPRLFLPSADGNHTLAVKQELAREMVRASVREALTVLEASGKWKIVPVEPSERMLEAGAYNEWENHDESSASIVWRLMLSASPKVTR